MASEGADSALDQAKRLEDAESAAYRRFLAAIERGDPEAEVKPLKDEWATAHRRFVAYVHEVLVKKH